jgi:hypothetical protein
VVDGVVQSALVELFAAYRLAVAPLPRLALERAPTPAEVSATAGFGRGAGDTSTGRLTLSVPTAVLELMRQGAESSLKTDWVRELTNQLVGRIKNRLLQFDVRLQVGILSAIDSQIVARRLETSSSLRVYPGRTLRGDVLVTVEGLPDDADLRYVGPTQAASEGDIILF